MRHTERKTGDEVGAVEDDNREGRNTEEGSSDGRNGEQGIRGGTNSEVPERMAAEHELQRAQILLHLQHRQLSESELYVLPYQSSVREFKSSGSE